MTPLEKVKKAILIETQLKDFGRDKADQDGNIEFVTTTEKIVLHERCCEKAARAALLTLAECELPGDKGREGVASPFEGIERLSLGQVSTFRAVLRAIASQEDGQ
jgi:hypothetical protein